MSDYISRQAVLNTLDNMDKALDEERTVEKYKELLTECIKVLPSDENKGDLISRQAAIDAFERFIHELGIKDEPYNYGEMALSVQNVPSVENKGEWIPFSKELPPKGKKVHVSTFGIVTIGERTSEANEALRLSILEPMNNLYKNIDPKQYQITHWQPLPEPYKEEKGGE